MSNVKKFTLKQLYGYSIMNWEQFYRRLDHAISERVCSFCNDATGSDCRECRIDHDICIELSNLNESIYGNIVLASDILDDYVYEIIDALKEKYWELEKNER